MTTNPKPPTEAQRRAAMKRRQETSALWMAIHLLGSLNLAVILLITIASAIAFATVMESHFDSAVARYYIYDAAWFTIWLTALGLNLLCAALTRWPWQRKHVGFVVTHAGIILMLTGAVVGRLWGFEAFVTLDKTKPPESHLYMKENLLFVDSGGARGQMPFNTEVRPPTAERPFVLNLDNPPLRLVIDKVTENLAPDDTLVASTDAGMPAGVALRFLNRGMGQDVPAMLTSTDDGKTYDFFGMAKVLFVDSLDEAHPITAKPVSSPVSAPKPKADPAKDTTPFRETQLVFANSPDTPVVDRDSEASSGYAFSLKAVPGKAGELVVVATPMEGKPREWPLKELTGQWHNFNGDGDPVLFRVAQYWPEFAMKGNAPVSLSDQPKNPAALIQITGPKSAAWHDSKAAPAPGIPAGKDVPPPMPKGLIMRVALAKEPGKIVYELEREGTIERRGTAAQGETIELGWSKWLARIDGVFPHAEIHREVKEFTGQVTPMLAATLRPGLHAQVQKPDGTGGPAEWVPAGTSRVLFSGTDFSSSEVRIGYGQRVIPLSFTITLEDFQVPRDEGTETPSDYISHVRFDEAATGKVVRGTAHMNSPAMFPGDFWRSLLGWNYKFSQANWNPQNLNETTLQVLYDPGWPFKWVGSLAICAGIALMFYFMPKRSAVERGGREGEEEKRDAIDA